MLSIGCEVVYSRGVEHLATEMLSVRPSIMTMVPRILEVIRARILAQVARQPALQRWLFARAIAIGTRRVEGKWLPPHESLLDPLLDRLVRRKIRARFGGRLRAVVSGGARLEPEVGRLFLAHGIALLQGYGQTEAGPVVSATPPKGTGTSTPTTKPLAGRTETRPGSCAPSACRS